MTETHRSDEPQPIPVAPSTSAGWPDAAPAILWITDPTGSCTYLNKTWYATTGQSPSAAEGFGWLDATHLDDAEAAGAAFIAANAAHTPFRCEYRLRQADGSFRSCVDVGNPHFALDGSYLGMVGTVFDIDTAKRTQDALVASEARFRAAVAAVQGVMWTNTAEGEMRGEQPGWTALTGQNYNDYQGYGWSKAVHSEDAGPTIDAWNLAVAQRLPFEFEHRLTKADGECRLFAVRAVPTFDANGAITEWIGVHTDITDERAVQEALRESYADYRYAAELNPQVTWTATPDGQFDRVAERWDDWTDTSGLGASWGEGLHADDLSHTTDAWVHSVTTGDPYDVEHRVKRVDGSYRCARSRAWARRDPDGEIVKWYGSTEDIDDRKAAEVRAHERARELRGVVEAMPGFVWTADDQGGLIYTSPTWHDYSGSKADDSAGSGWAGFVHSDDQTRAFDQWARSIRTGEPYEVEFRLRAADGSHHWWLARALKQADGGGWIGIATELDAIVAARETLTRSREELEREVSARTAELRETEAQLRQSQKLEAIGQLTGGVAHDFNNLLTVIRGSVDLLRRPGLTDERRDRYIEAISDTVTRAAKLTGQLLAFARRQALKPEIFDVGAAIVATRDMIKTLTGSRIRIVTDFPDPSCFVNADLSQFDTAIINMIVNARDAMDGEGTLIVSVHGSNAIPAGHSHPAIKGEFVAVTIRDTGAGIAAERLDQVFEPFFTTKDVGQGTGLGLSQVYGFAKQSGGEVRVESIVGEGAAFTLYLPCAGADVAPKAKSTPLVPLAAGHGTCVLVVEDNADVGHFAQQTLAELGYRTTFAPDGEAALAALENGADGFDVVFSDVVMPGMNGIDLAQTIRARHPHLPVILTSGYSHVLAREGSAGFELLRKPYSMEELSRVLQAATTSHVGVGAAAVGGEIASTNGATSAP